MIALVTGGASGIGRAAVEQLRARGDDVVVADLDAPAGEAVAAELGVRFVRADVREPDANAGAVSACVEAFGGLDLVLLNAGIATTSPDGLARYDVATLPLDRFRLVLGVNAEAVFYGVRAALPALRARGAGSIVVTASLSGLVAHTADPVYCMSKHAVVGLVRALGPALQPDHVRVNAVCPGFVDTPLLAGARAHFTTSGFPLLQPAEVAAALLTVAAGDTTGEAFVVQPGLAPTAYRFRGVPGPRVPGAEGATPPAGLA